MGKWIKRHEHDMPKTMHRYDDIDVGDRWQCNCGQQFILAFKVFVQDKGIGYYQLQFTEAD